MMLWKLAFIGKKNMLGSNVLEGGEEREIMIDRQKNEISWKLHSYN